jgi:hypothetical protein
MVLDGKVYHILPYPAPQYAVNLLFFTQVSKFPGPAPPPYSLLSSLVSLRTKSQISIVTSGTCWSGPLPLCLRSRSRTISRPLSLPASYYSSSLRVRCISRLKHLLTCISVPPPRCAVLILMSCRSLSVQNTERLGPHLRPPRLAARPRARSAPPLVSSAPAAPPSARHRS